MLTIAEVLRYSLADNFAELTGINPLEELDELEAGQVEHVIAAALRHPDLAGHTGTPIAEDSEIADHVNDIAFNVLLDLNEEGEL